MPLLSCDVPDLVGLRPLSLKPVLLQLVQTKNRALSPLQPPRFITRLYDYRGVFFQKLDVSPVSFVDFLIFQKGNPELKKVFGDVGLNSRKIWFVVFIEPIFSGQLDVKRNALAKLLRQTALYNFSLNPNIDLEKLKLLELRQRCFPLVSVKILQKPWN